MGRVVTAWTHISRGWGRDPFAPECGCTVLACGFVEPRNECDQHGLMSGKTIRGGHAASECPANTNYEGKETK